MLKTIPIYRMVLAPDSFVLQAHRKSNIIDLICELPNSINEHRRKALSLLPADQHESYYNARLLLETKRFIREMFQRCNVKDTEYIAMLQGQNWQPMFWLISLFRLPFFRCLILEDLQKFDLFKGYMEQEIKASTTVADIQKYIRKYGSMQKLIYNLTMECHQLRRIYC